MTSKKMIALSVGFVLLVVVAQVIIDKDKYWTEWATPDSRNLTSEIVAPTLPLLPVVCTTTRDENWDSRYHPEVLEGERFLTNISEGDEGNILEEYETARLGLKAYDSCGRLIEAIPVFVQKSEIAKRNGLVYIESTSFQPVSCTTARDVNWKH